MRRTEYLSDQELEQLMEEASQSSLAPPEYLSRQIIETSRQQGHSLHRKQAVSAKRQLFTYSMKITLAMAASLALLVFIPVMEESSRMTPEQLQAYRNELQQEAVEARVNQREVQREQQEKEGVLSWLNDTTGNFCSALNEKSTSILIKEDE